MADKLKFWIKYLVVINILPTFAALFQKYTDMKKNHYLVLSVLVILLLTIAAVWLVDATVQIDDDYAILCVFLLVLDAVLSSVAYWGYKRFVA